MLEVAADALFRQAVGRCSINEDNAEVERCIQKISDLRLSEARVADLPRS